MNEDMQRKELERRLEQARRMVKAIADPVTLERLTRLVRELEDQLK